MTVSKEFKVGLLALISGTILYFGFNYLKGINVFSDSQHYYAIYDRVDGLQISNPIMVNGFAVGRVSQITILQDRGNVIQVELEIDADVQIGNASEVYLADNGLLGGKMIDLRLQPGTGVLPEGSEIKGLRVEAMTAMLQEKAAPLMAGIDTMMTNVNRLISSYSSMSGDVKTLVQNAANAAHRADQMLAANQQELSAMLRNFSKLSAKLVEQQQRLDPILAKMDAIGDSLTKIEVAALASDMRATVAELNTTLAGINRAEGSMGKLMKDEQLYANMNQTLRDLDSLFIDLREQPKRYVHFSLFGRKEKEEKKGK
jgi:phospholipid/cholesterol/gamma-HCH transport system substrate-binding protein